MPAHPDGEADNAERWHKATSLWQSPAMTLGQVEEEAGLDRGRLGNPHLLTWLWVHPLLLPFPPSPSKGNPTGLGAEISYHHSLCRVIPAALGSHPCAHYFSSAYQLILLPSTKPSASLQNGPWPLEGRQEQPSQEGGQGIKVSTHARELLQER